MKTASRFLRQMSKGLQFLHSINVIHRDLKPANMLLTTSDIDTAEVKIADFGLARVLNKTDLSTTVCGSPLFMAPELLCPRDADVTFTNSVDFYSLGAILYNMVRGCIEPQCFYYQTVKGKKPILDNLDPHVNADCRDVLKKLLEVDPTQRITHDDLLAHAFLQPPVP